MTTTKTYPILYSLRNCPYAMRARIAIFKSKQTVQLRDLVLSNKPEEMLIVSPKGTVPVVVLADGRVIEESLDVMLWALEQADPEHWLHMPEKGYDWISRGDGPFKQALDHTKYAVRFPDLDHTQELGHATEFLQDLNDQIAGFDWMFGANCTFADMALLPFVRQFANIDRIWFNQKNWPHLHRWLDKFLATDRFTEIMLQYERWHTGDSATIFPNHP